MPRAAVSSQPKGGVYGKQLAHGLDVTRYARMVASGEILAGLKARQACERHLKDLDRSAAGDPDFPYEYDPVAAGKVLYWIERMPHVEGGPWPTPTILLELWQKFTYGCPFGWLHKETRLRRFDEVYVSVARKNGKTAILAAICWYMLLCDGEPGPQVFNAANKLEQAEILFKAAAAQMEKRPELFARFGVVKRGEKRFFVPKTNGRWRYISRTPGDGGGASFFVQDEFHEAKSKVTTDAMVQGMGARRHGLAWFITTAGFNLAGPCYEKEQLVYKILDGSMPLESTFAIVYAPDLERYKDPKGKEREADEWTSLDAAKKANPNWGISVFPEPFFKALAKAKADPGELTTFKTKRLNIWCNAAAGYYNLQQWEACYQKGLTLEDFAGQDCCYGIDLANKLDLCAGVLVFQKWLPAFDKVTGKPIIDPETGEQLLLDHYYVFLRAWLPAAIARDPRKTHYRTWEQAGYLTVTDGDITDYRRILRDILADAENYAIREVDFDQRESGFLLQEFGAKWADTTQYEVVQNVEELSEPLKWVKSLVVDGRIHHGANPVLTWAFSNVLVKPDYNENVFPRAASDELKIDPHSALLNAMVRVRDVLSHPVEQSTGVEVW